MRLFRVLLVACLAARVLLVPDARADDYPRGFIEAQGGRIEAQNRSDRSGAVFTIRIPVPEAVEIREPAAVHG